ncbi:hypothetical protein UYSO10_3940 [Kosakonia radicincitans]|uniref:PerC family transcriptional regulator n=1 Tax=Kosakonia radicincitans TaxID=283686 RepID=UPI0011829584|nr:PerC family transcriptional regulator [Kosakonia radicincitans]VVT52240.1 hypothetical protein UYSO10_3940 [Kosakonia radicincitans]
MTNRKVTQIDRVAVFVAGQPGCVLGDVCEAFDTAPGTAGRQLRKLVECGILARNHNGTQYTYTVAPCANIPDIELPFLAKKADPEIMRPEMEAAKALEERGCYNRAAAKYTALMALARNEREVSQLARLRQSCYRKARAGRV